MINIFFRFLCSRHLSDSDRNSNSVTNILKIQSINSRKIETAVLEMLGHRSKRKDLANKIGALSGTRMCIKWQEMSWPLTDCNLFSSEGLYSLYNTSLSHIKYYYTPRTASWDPCGHKTDSGEMGSNIHLFSQKDHDLLNSVIHQNFHCCLGGRSRTAGSAIASHLWLLR